MKALLILAFAALNALATEGLVREVTSLTQIVGNQPIPGFRNGYLFFLEHSSVRVYSPEGVPVFAAVLNVPNATDISARGLAIDTDGSIAISVDYQTAGGFGGGVDFLDITGRQTAFLDTGLYMPSNICYGDDHSLWTFGWQRDAVLQNRPDRGDYMMVRKYSQDREESGRYLARSLFPAGLSPGTASWQSLRIAAAHDRVGLLARSGNTCADAEWVELTLDGNLIRRVPIENCNPNIRIAFTSDGHLYRHKTGLNQLLVLDPNTPTWSEAGLSLSHSLWGADGNLLVFSKGGSGSIGLEWFEQPSLPAPASSSMTPEQ